MLRARKQPKKTEPVVDARKDHAKAAVAWSFFFVTKE